MTRRYERAHLVLLAVIAVVGLVIVLTRPGAVSPTRSDAVSAGLTAQRVASPCNPPEPAQMGACAPRAAYAALNASATLTHAPLATDPSGLLGPDVSSYQPWACGRWAHARIAFAIVKAGEGESWTDPTFRCNWRTLRRLRIPHTAYYFVRPAPGHSASYEAHRFAAIVGSAGGFDSLPPAIDVEASEGFASAAGVHHWVATFDRTLRALTHRKSIVYTGAWFWNGGVGGSSIGSLWVSGYAPAPAVPYSWRGYLIWQYTDGNYGPVPHALPGFGASDASVFHGSRHALLALAHMLPKPKPRVRPADRRLVGLIAKRDLLRRLEAKHSCRRHPRRYGACRVWLPEGQQVNNQIRLPGGR